MERKEEQSLEKKEGKELPILDAIQSEECS
jgi:hypothetical protein